MLYNLRSDIIYYKSGSDFELEFNLCGCCRMRLLTDKPSNKKTFVHSLARAVSRSRVILITGPLFGEDNTIEIVAQALGTTTEVVNYKAYNIASDDEIEIIKGSLPLVSDDGSFGGCIIESGPQTMILLTDNKTLRKSIMSYLIHPYISELYAAEMQGNNKAAFPDESVTPVFEETDNSVETELIIETTESNIESENEFSLVLESDEEQWINDDIKPEDIIFESEETKAEEYESDGDIKFEDLFPSTPELEEPSRTIDEKIDEANIVFDSEEFVNGDLPEEYEKNFNSLIIGAESDNDQPQRHDKPDDAFRFIDDEGEFIGERETIFENRKSGLSIATIIFTVILLLAIITLCLCIFTASTNEGMAPSEYIRSVWQTLFG